AAGIPAANMRVPVIQVVLLRLDAAPFVTAATIIPHMQKAAVSVTNKNKKNNKSKKNAPNDTGLKTAGHTTKRRPGPASGSRPKANTAGKIASPARNEIKIFIVTIVKADFGKSSCLDK